MRAAALHPRHTGFAVLSCLALSLSLSTRLHAQQQLGTVIGEVRIQRGDFPSQKVMVSLMIRGAPMASTYTDDQGRFGFYALPLDLYYVDINDDDYQSVHERAMLSPFTSSVFLQITLVPKTATKGEKPATQLSGGNPNVMDVKEYAKRFPKKAFKEFQKGVQADQDGKRDDAIRHYEKSLQIAPDFYPAHNNLGSDELGRNNLPDARREFEKVIQLNQTDA